MSTKNLARTAIEGGRIASNKFSRRSSRQKERVRARILCRDSKYLMDPDDQTKVAVPRPVRREQGDKLGAPFRWLRSKVGRSWNDVFSEMVQKYNCNTIAGRHIVFDHLIRSVTIKKEVAHPFFQRDFYVDEEGILQLNEKNRWSKRNKRYGYDPYSAELRKWFGVNRVMDLGRQQFWMMPTKVEHTRCGDPHHCVAPFKEHKRETERRFYAFFNGYQSTVFKMEYNENGEYGYYFTDVYYTCQKWTEYRQHSPLTPEQKQFWFSLSVYTRQAFQHFTAAQTKKRWRK